MNKKEFRLFHFSLWHLLVPVFIGVIILVIEFPKGFLSLNMILYVLFYSISMGLPFIKGSEYFRSILDKRLPWLHKPLLRLILSLLIDILWLSLIVFFVNTFFQKLILHKNFIEVINITFYGFRYAFVFLLIGILTLNGILFFKNWKQSAVNEEILKREKLAIEYEALKNQVNPHFLFNSLTALTSLVYTDQEKAVIFIRNFSDVYRYVLEFQGKEIIDLASERKLIESVAFLYKIRYEENLQIDIDLPDTENKFIIPMALQMLLENAVKHNIISENQPLRVEIKEREGFIEVKNNLQPKTVITNSSKIGLKNIISQYKYLSDKEVIVEVTDKFYTVKIPVLNNEK